MINKKVVTFVENSKNSKIGDMAATYVSIAASCSNDCALKNAGCYASLGNTGFVTRRLDKIAEENNVSDVEAAQQERDVIISSFNGKKIPNGKPLRLHVSGDCKSKEAVKILNEGIDDYVRRGGKVYSYTHSAKRIPRSAWTKNISILGSVDSIEEVKKVRRKGYAPAIVVPSFDSHKAFKIKGCKTKFIPCPSQTKENVTCIDCKLCMRADELYNRNYGIAFESHGVRKNTINKRLNVIK